MLRRALKRSKNPQQQDKTTDGSDVKRQKKVQKVLGSKSEKDEAEKVLEQLVVGDERELLDNLDSSLSKKKKGQRKVHKEEEPKPVWQDDDDDKVTVAVENVKKNPKLAHLKNTSKTEISADKYKEALKKQFEKVSGTPVWAKLKWEREENPDGDSDSDSEELLQRTGNYLSAPDVLTKGIIQMKACTDANKESPAQARLRSVQFHPTAQVVLTAGMNQTLSLFQVDGKNNPKIQSVFLERFPIHAARFTTDGQQVIMGSRHKNFYYYDMIAGKVVNVPHIRGLEHEKMGNFVISPDGRYIAFLGKYGHIHLISAQSKEWVSSLKMNGSVEGVAFNSDGSQMFSTGDDGEVYVWDMSTRDCIHKFVDEGCIKGTAIAASKNGQYLATGSNSGVVNIYDSSYMNSHSPKPLKAVMNLTTSCTDMVFNSTTEILAISSHDAERAVKLVHFPSMTVFSNYPDKTDNIRIPFCMDFSLHSGYFTIGNNKGQALLYRVKHYGNY